MLFTPESAAPFSKALPKSAYGLRYCAAQRNNESGDFSASGRLPGAIQAYQKTRRAGRT